MYSFKTIKERGKKRELTITHNGMWEEWDQHLFLFCYKMILRFKNAQFPVKTTQQLSQMPSLKPWQESFLLTFISAFPPPIPSHFQRTGCIDFFTWDLLYFCMRIPLLYFQMEKPREPHLLLFPHLQCWDGSELCLVAHIRQISTVSSEGF